MNIFKKLFKVTRLLNSDLSPSKIAIAGVIGMYWGLSPFLSPHNLILFFIVVIFKIPISFAISGMVFFLPFSFFFADLINTFGSIILKSDILSGSFRSLYNSFFILTKFNNTFIMGSFIIILILSIPVFLILRFIVIKYRKTIISNLLASAIYQKFLRKTFVFDLMFNIKYDKLSTMDNSKSKTGILSWVDWKFFLPIIVVVILIVIALKFFLDDTIKDIIAKEATEYNKALVELSRFSSSFTDAKVGVYNFRWTDNKNMRNNLFQFDKFTADAEIFPLLRGRIVFEELSIVDVRLNTPRKKSGEIPRIKSVSPQVPSSKISPKSSPPQPETANNKKSKNRNEKGESRIKPVPNDGFKQKVQDELDEMLDEAKIEVKRQGDEIIKQNRELIVNYEKQIVNIEKSYNFQTDIDRLKSININKIKDLPSALAAANKIGGIDASIKKTDNAKRKLNKLKQSLEKDFKQFEKSVDLDNIKKEMEKRILKILGLNSLSLSGFTERVFGPAIANQINPFIDQYEKYKYLLVKKRDELEKEPEVTYDPSIRAGRDIRYPINSHYPRFYIKKIRGSGDSNVDGIYHLDIDNLSSDPSFAPIKNTIALKHEIYNIGLQGKLALKKGKFEIVQRIKSQPFPIAKVINISPNIFIESLKNGNAEVIGKIEDRNQKIILSVSVKVKDIAFNINSELHREIRKILEKTLNSIDVLTLRVKMIRTQDSKVKLDVTSNLDQLLKINFSGFFKQQASQKRKEALNKLNKAINPILAQVNKELKKNADGNIFKNIESQINLITRDTNILKKKINQLKKNEENKLLNEAKKVIPEKIKDLPKIKSPF